MWAPGKIVPGDKPEHKYQCEGKPRNTELIVQGTVWYGTVLYQTSTNYYNMWTRHDQGVCYGTRYLWRKQYYIENIRYVPIKRIYAGYVPTSWGNQTILCAEYYYYCTYILETSKHEIRCTDAYQANNKEHWCKIGL